MQCIHAGNGDVVHPFRRASQFYGLGQSPLYAKNSQFGRPQQTESSHPP
jgi:hypothetical protein